MWPWTRREPTNNDVMERLATLEGRMKAVELEWASVADKLLHRIQRQAKRDRDALAAAADVQERPVNGGGPPTPAPTGKAALRARLAAAERQQWATRTSTTG